MTQSTRFTSLSAFVSTKTLHSLFHEFERALRAVTPQRFEFAALKFVVRNEEIFNVIQDFWIKIGNGLCLAMDVGVSGGRYQPVIATGCQCRS